MRRAMMPLAILLLAGALLTGCGRVGPPRPPGPPEQVTYPRAYPAPDPAPGAPLSRPPLRF